MKTNILNSKILTPMLSAALLILSAHASAVTLQEIEQEGVLKVVTEDNYAPFNFIKRGEPKGFNNELLAEFQAYSKDKFEVQQTIMPWTGLLASVTAGQYNLTITGVMATAERAKVLNFSYPVASAQTVYAKRADNDSITDIKSLDGKTMGVQSGTVFYNNINQLEDMLALTGGKVGKIIQYQSYPEAYADLANGRVDYVINAETNINDLVKKRGNIFAKGQAVSKKGYFAWATSKTSPELLTYTNAFIKQMKTTGKLKELQMKWFGQSFDNLPDLQVITQEDYLLLSEYK